MDTAIPDADGVIDYQWSEVGPGPRYALMRRHDPTFTAAGFAVTWETNCTYFHGSPTDAGAQNIVLYCNNETDPEAGGSDDIRLSLWADGIQYFDRAPAGEFEEGDEATLYFITSITTSNPSPYSSGNTTWGPDDFSPS